LAEVETYGPWGLVAGASAGLGAAFAEEIAQKGINLVTIARRSELLEAEADRLRSEYAVEVRPVTADLTSSSLADEIRPVVADLDVGLLVYNATLSPAGRFFDIPLEDHLAGVAINCNGPTVLAHLLGPAMVARGSGGMVFVSSMGALQGAGTFTSYFAGKAYDWILGEGLWAELRGTGVHAVSYMVGATAGDNYDPEVMASGAPAEEIEVDDHFQTSMNRVHYPSAPAAVAGRLFELLPKGPTVFPSEIDERTAERVLKMRRNEAVELMSRLTGSTWG
jgi:short-subunit dehydrogenase